MEITETEDERDRTISPTQPCPEVVAAALALRGPKNGRSPSDGAGHSHDKNNKGTGKGKNTGGKGKDNTGGKATGKGEAKGGKGNKGKESNDTNKTKPGAKAKGKAKGKAKAKAKKTENKYNLEKKDGSWNARTTLVDWKEGHHKKYEHKLWIPRHGHGKGWHEWLHGSKRWPK